MKPNIYLDVDGVLLDGDHQLANYANEFIRKVVTEYPNSVYWLTTRCNGDAKSVVDNIGRYFDPDVERLLGAIKPTSWQTAKTNGIDFTRPFLWFDDNLFYGEKQVLGEHGALDNWIEINLKKNPDQLGEFLDSFPIFMKDTV